MARHIVIGYGFGASGLYWTGAGWTSDLAAARRYDRIERETLRLPRGGWWTTAPLTSDAE